MHWSLNGSFFSQRITAMNFPNGANLTKNSFSDSLCNGSGGVGRSLRVVSNFGVIVLLDVPFIDDALEDRRFTRLLKALAIELLLLEMGG